MIIRFLISTILIGFTLSHPTKYKVDRNISCVQPEPALIQSYHIHVFYMHKNENNTKAAHDLKEKFRTAFKDTLGPDCHDLFHNDYNCMLDEGFGPEGPFTTAQWAVFVLPGHIE